jgi:signal transduction histidine kinase/CheY-like chemotaxis protein
MGLIFSQTLIRVIKTGKKSSNSAIFFRYRLGQLLFLFIFLAGVLVSVQLGRFDSERQYSNEEIKVLSELSAIRVHLEGVVASTFNLTQGMIHYISHQHDISLDLFNAMTRRALQENRHIRNIALAPNNEVRWVYPLEGNEKALDLHYLENPQQRESVLNAQRVRKPLLAGPVELVQGGVGFINRSPILMGEGSDSLKEYWGLASIVAYVNTILEDGEVTSSEYLNVSLNGKDGKGAKGEMIWGDSTVLNCNPVILEVNVPGGKWQLAAIPKNGWPTQSIAKSRYFIVGLINTFIISFFLLILIGRNRSIRVKNIELAQEISQRKKVEEELIKSKEVAESANRMKTAFLANMSHEIRTPMNSILGFSDLMISNKQTKEDTDYYLKIINTSTRQLLCVINDIIDISIIETGQLKIFNRLTKLNSLLMNIYQLHRIKAELNGVTLTLYKGLPDCKANIITDDQRLTQVLNNLVNNAIKFTEKGDIEVGYALKEKFIEFYVKDTGRGIPAEYHELIFERFRQVDEHQKNTFGGTGLGLAISRSLVELMGGRIWLQSEVDKGSQFFFTIPYDPVNTDSTPDRVVESVNLEGKTILIAEDDSSNYLLLEGYLKSSKVNILSAKNGVEALELFFTNQQIDLVMLDIKMPLLNGLDAAIEIRKVNKQIPIIAQTAYAMIEDKDNALAAGCNYYLSKPISKSQLFEVLKTIFG